MATGVTPGAVNPSARGKRAAVVVANVCTSLVRHRPLPGSRRPATTGA
jgi:hypothetical protein